MICFFSENSVAITIGDSTGSSSPLCTAAFAAWDYDHFLCTGGLVKHFALNIATINDKLNVRNSDGALGNICRQYDFAIKGGLKYFLLILGGQVRMQRQNIQFPLILILVRI